MDYGKIAGALKFVVNEFEKITAMEGGNKEFEKTNTPSTPCRVEDHEVAATLQSNVQGRESVASQPAIEARSDGGIL